ncbi:MAG: hypothetical protein JWQ77_1686 [Jatrophihabitans sp.]|nr:hypothetical protein [Jatrophihabitans sp.]
MNVAAGRQAGWAPQLASRPRGWPCTREDSVSVP